MFCLSIFNFFNLIYFFSLIFIDFLECSKNNNIKIVISTWNFQNATQEAWRELVHGSGLSQEAIIKGCSWCERNQCDGTVGFGGSPDENGESTLDAMIMDGKTMDVGAVANLREVKHAIAVARAVLIYTEHTLLVGSLATDFAVSMGFQRTNLSTDSSIKLHSDWRKKNCQPNFWKPRSVSPDPSKLCGPYKPNKQKLKSNCHESDRICNERYNEDNVVAHLKNNKLFEIDPFGNHDTIGMVVMNGSGNVVVGTSTNGLKFKIPGRVGDSPIVGSGGYADDLVGGAVATGDGDILMRFLPSFHVVELMRTGVEPQNAAEKVISRIMRYYPNFRGALIATNLKGDFGASCHGMDYFPYSVMSSRLKDVTLFKIKCI